MFSWVCLSILLAFGIAVLLVEKGGEWPVKLIRIFLQWLVHKVSWKLSQVFYCTVCTSFWAALVADIILLFFSGFTYFFWPFSGFIAAGFTWFIIEYLNAID